MIRDDKIHAILRARAAPQVRKIRDIRRNIVGHVPTGTPATPRTGLTGSLFPSMVRKASVDEVVLKGGENVQKLGGVVLAGPLKGARLVSLALEERATCPKTCALWNTCYTNNMPRLVRYRADDVLLAKILCEVDDLCAAHPKVLVRLHMSGDFYSVAYLAFWEGLLDRYPGLHVFGFTAWPESSEIGALIAELRQQMPQRFAVRTSGRTGTWGSFTLPFPTDRPIIGDAVVCPEQRDAMEGFKKGVHCGSCGLCWKTGGNATGRPICFVEH